MGDLVVRDRVARVLWRFACPPKLREELAGSPPPVFVRMADAVMAELAAIRAENAVAASAMDDYLRNVEVMDRAGFLARYGQGDAERVPSPSEDALQAAGRFMAAMEAEEHARLSLLPPVVPAVEWASVGCGGAPIALVVVEGPSAGVRVGVGPAEVGDWSGGGL